MLQLAMEIPAAFLGTYTPLTDLDFVLAHKILEDGDYCRFYAERPKGRRLILDNSMHELGAPLNVLALKEAATRCNADFVVAPDKLGDPQFGLDQYQETVQYLGNDFKIAVVLCGPTSQQRKQFLEVVKYADMICLPFREDRRSWYIEHHDQIGRYTYVHLLGVSELPELTWFAEHAGTSYQLWSVDTAKPIKWGVANTKMDRLKSLRGASLSSKDLLDLREITGLQHDMIEWNIHVLRKAMNQA